ncbi:hypothetical protein EDB85DRAFT_1464974 [Lactarius pseudohatsudake]|nr:hypothetical protein EDB85DRAFT_1464974 [Lactarius pseudohatsudake]
MVARSRSGSRPSRNGHPRGVRPWFLAPARSSFFICVSCSQARRPLRRGQLLRSRIRFLPRRSFGLHRAETSHRMRVPTEYRDREPGEEMPEVVCRRPRKSEEGAIPLFSSTFSFRIKLLPGAIQGAPCVWKTRCVPPSHTLGLLFECLTLVHALPQRALPRNSLR